MSDTLARARIPAAVDRPAAPALLLAGLVAAALLAPAARAADPVVGEQAIVGALTPKPRTRGLVVQAAPPPTIDLAIPFDFDSADLSRDAVGQVRELGTALASPALGPFTFELAGHTDARGTPGYNQALSQRRAETVKRALVEQFGIAPTRLKTVGWGFQKPKDPAHPEDAVNRRVQVTNLGNG